MAHLTSPEASDERASSLRTSVVRGDRAIVVLWDMLPEILLRNVADARVQATLARIREEIRRIAHETHGETWTQLVVRIPPHDGDDRTLIGSVVAIARDWRTLEDAFACEENAFVRALSEKLVTLAAQIEECWTRLALTLSPEDGEFLDSCAQMLSLFDQHRKELRRHRADAARARHPGRDGKFADQTRHAPPTIEDFERQLGMRTIGRERYGSVRAWALLFGIPDTAIALRVDWRRAAHALLPESEVRRSCAYLIQQPLPAGSRRSCAVHHGDGSEIYATTDEWASLLGVDPATLRWRLRDFPYLHATGAGGRTLSEPFFGKSVVHFAAGDLLTVHSDRHA